jgi:hypothetical protein
VKRRYVWDRAARDGSGDWVDPPPRRGRLGVTVISDALEGVLNPVDGRRYDSKAAYHAAVRRAGCEVVGNDAAFAPAPARHRPRDIGLDVKRALEALGG